MFRNFIALITLLALTSYTQAHFIWLVPGDKPNTVKLVFGDKLGPDLDNPDLIDKVKQTGLYIHDPGSKHIDLTMQPDKDTEFLIGIGADGSSKRASDSKGNSEMSKGTRFQLYLALRVAGYHEFACSRRPVPFIADDIMETFDDFRAEEAFRLFSEMAEVGQVIYLTHHRHLCDIAQRVCPRIKVHELPPANEQ